MHRFFAKSPLPKITKWKCHKCNFKNGFDKDSELEWCFGQNLPCKGPDCENSRYGRLCQNLDQDGDIMTYCDGKQAPDVDAQNVQQKYNSGLRMSGRVSKFRRANFIQQSSTYRLMF